MRIVFFLSLCFHLFASNPFDQITPSAAEEVFSLSNDQLIENHVSALSGQISLAETDLCVKGAQDLLLKRVYLPPQIQGSFDTMEGEDSQTLNKALSLLGAKGWVFHPHLWAGINSNSPYFQIRDPRGFVLGFKIKGNKGFLKTTSYGCTNLRGEEPSSFNDIRNISLIVEGEQVKVTWPDGLQRVYRHTDKGYYRLERELLSNGKAIRYQYANQQLTKIFSTDLSGKHVYASIDLDQDHLYRGSDGRAIKLIYETKEIKGEFKRRHQIHEWTRSFQMMNRAKTPLFENVAEYNEKMLLTSYDLRAYPISCSYAQTRDLQRGIFSRIQTFSTPSSSTTFTYNTPVEGQKGGDTTVSHPSGAQTIYRFNKHLLIESIENWLEGKLINKKAFVYDGKQHIKEIATLDGDGNLLISKRYECDEFGNPLVEKKEGDFGAFAIRRKFDQNRLIFEDRDDGLQTEFTYLGNTHLVTSKTTLERGEKRQQIIYEHDEANNLVGENEVGKTKTRFLLYQAAPHLHCVEWKEKTDWEGKLIHKIHYAYDQWGNVDEEFHFGSDGEFAYAIERTYNEKGELLCETNPLRDAAVYQYDERGRCTYEEPISNGKVINREFDTKGRLCRLKENGCETNFVYNSSDELVEKTDYLGFTTKYQVHPVHRKPVQIEEGSFVTKIVYDAFGREKEIIDACNGVTHKEYTSYGSVAKIIWPEGGEEAYSYAPNGLLMSFQDPDGLKTTYSHDALGRVVEKKVGGNTTAYHYDGYNLIEEVDALGYHTTYQYDALNRKIEENRENRITHYGYDSLGFLAWEERGNRRVEFTHDAMGQLRKKLVDGLIETSWKYDAAGNVAEIAKEGATTFDYDAHNRLIKKTTPTGAETRITYEVGPQCLLKKVIDPLGMETIETLSPHGQRIKKEVAGQVVESVSFDPLFRVTSQDHLTFGYTPNGNKEWIKEGAKKTTKWAYTPGNRVKTMHKPNGTVLNYEYDLQQRLVKVGSRKFSYDSLDRIIGGTFFSRTLDPFGNVKREEWSNGLWVESDYDDWNRPVERRLPDQSRIGYQYAGPFLKKVIRFGKDGAELYTHTYNNYDAHGNLLSEKGLFTTTYSYDQLGRKISQKNSYFSESMEYNELGELTKKGGRTYTYDPLSQMTAESSCFSASYDAHFNLVEFNGKQVGINELNQVEGQTYDLNGNLIKLGFAYDEFDQLTIAQKERYVYDALGRRIQKGQTAFLYTGDEEIGAFEKNKPRELKVGGLTLIAIELDGNPFIPVVDSQQTIRLLIDPTASEYFPRNDCDAFGAGLTDAIPYAYRGKRFDPTTRLVYCGQRYYDPTLRRWLTPDLQGPIAHSNLYQYEFNNPYGNRTVNGVSNGMSFQD